MTNKNTRQILYKKSAGYRPDALGRSILKNCRANVSCAIRYVSLSINLPFCRGRSRARDNVLSPHPAQAEHTLTAYCTVASPALPAAPGCCRTRPPRRCSRWQRWSLNFWLHAGFRAEVPHRPSHLAFCSGIVQEVQ